MNLSYITSSSHFKPNRKFRRDYKRLFRKDPLAANAFLLFCELADSRGRIVTSLGELPELMAIRFEEPWRYQL